MLVDKRVKAVISSTRPAQWSPIAAEIQAYLGNVNIHQPQSALRFVFAGQLQEQVIVREVGCMLTIDLGPLGGANLGHICVGDGTRCDVTEKTLTFLTK